MAEESEIAEPDDNDDEMDGCDCSSAEGDPTPDEDLPAADGGVA
jgi:hypothetical protein